MSGLHTDDPDMADSHTDGSHTDGLNMAGLQIAGTVANPNFTLDIAISAAPGQTTALLGPNGSGKSTTVAAIAGLVPLSTGTIALGDRVLDDPQARTWVTPQQRHIGVCFQDRLLFDHMSALENVAFALTARGVARSQAQRQAHEALTQVGLAESHFEQSPAKLSGGQAQSVALARSLVGTPQLLLLDEPFGALDISVRTSLRRRFAQLLAHTDSARLLITHDPTDAFLLADVIYIIENGKITQAGTPAQIRQRPLTAYAADLAGTNLLTGVAQDGQVRLDSAPGHTAQPSQALQIADRSVSGPVLLTIHPRSATLHLAQPTGSPRNVWQAPVAAVEPRAEVTRVVLGPPISLSVDITTAAATEMSIGVGSQLWVAIKATEIEAVASDRVNGNR